MPPPNCPIRHVRPGLHSSSSVVTTASSPPTSIVTGPSRPQPTRSGFGSRDLLSSSATTIGLLTPPRRWSTLQTCRNERSSSVPVTRPRRTGAARSMSKNMAAFLTGGRLVLGELRRAQLVRPRSPRLASLSGPWGCRKCRDASITRSIASDCVSAAACRALAASTPGPVPVPPLPLPWPSATPPVTRWRTPLCRRRSPTAPGPPAGRPRRRGAASPADAPAGRRR